MNCFIRRTQLKKIRIRRGWLCFRDWKVTRKSKGTGFVSFCPSFVIHSYLLQQTTAKTLGGPAAVTLNTMLENIVAHPKCTRRLSQRIIVLVFPQSSSTKYVESNDSPFNRVELKIWVSGTILVSGLSPLRKWMYLCSRRHAVLRRNCNIQTLDTWIMLECNKCFGLMANCDSAFLLGQKRLISKDDWEKHAVFTIRNQHCFDTTTEVFTLFQPKFALWTAGDVYLF